MPTEPAAVRVRFMEIADIPAATAIERRSFAESWPETAFLRELQQNAIARYVVLESAGPDPEMLGFAGLWLLVDEAHVVTVAVAPEHRRRGYGRLLVHALVSLAEEVGMANATLECRVSNESARALYRQYGFYEVGRRKGYYTDNHEDAVIMTTEAFDTPAYRERLERLASKLPAPVNLPAGEPSASSC